MVDVTSPNVAAVGNALASGETTFASAPPIVRVLAAIAILLVLGAIPQTHTAALWLGLILLLLTIFGGQHHGF